MGPFQGARLNFYIHSEQQLKKGIDFLLSDASAALGHAECICDLSWPQSWYDREGLQAGSKKLVSAVRSLIWEAPGTCSGSVQDKRRQ